VIKLVVPSSYDLGMSAVSDSIQVLMRWSIRGRRPGWIATVATGIVMLIVVIEEDPTCSVASPCSPNPVDVTATGLLLAIPVAAFIDRFATRMLAGLTLSLTYLQGHVE
jgi:hypothetical protein